MGEETRGRVISDSARTRIQVLHSESNLLSLTPSQVALEQGYCEQCKNEEGRGNMESGKGGFLEEVVFIL